MKTKRKGTIFSSEKGALQLELTGQSDLTVIIGYDRCGYAEKFYAYPSNKEKNFWLKHFKTLKDAVNWGKTQLNYETLEK
jgi:hypothetical protein